MIDYQLKNCCKECSHINIQTDTKTTFKSFDLSDKRKDITIYCEHQEVCKKYIEEEKKNEKESV